MFPISLNELGLFVLPLIDLNNFGTTFVFQASAFMNSLLSLTRLSLHLFLRITFSTIHLFCFLSKSLLCEHNCENVTFPSLHIH